MSDTKLDQLIGQMENHLECWKQFNQFVHLARGKKFGPEDDNQFLEVKSVIIQELELICATIETNSPTKEEIHTLVGSAPSLRYLGELNESAFRNLESQWHRIYMGWHSIVGQLKVRQRAEKPKSGFGAMFGRNK